ncbi:MAG TPA: ABC transporter permease, partial [Longimicrobiales bacterium]|nr:ABC transporter permease [Longimicrobiales bacterium]
VGGSIMMNGNPFTVVGIMPPGTLLYGMDLWIPMGVDPAVFPRNRRQFQVMARVAPEFTLSAVNAELETLAARTEAAYGGEFPEYEGWRMEADTWTGANVRTLKPAAFILLGAVGFVLLLVCANIASLLLARSTTRRREMAVRAAMGAGRGRLVRQVLTESVALAVVGGGLGVALAWFGVDALGRVVAAIPFVSGQVALNSRVLLFTLLVSLGAGVAFGLAPAFQSVRSGVQGVLKSDGAGATGSLSRLRLQRIFVGVEVALSLVLLAGGGLLVNSVIRMNRVDPGFEPERVLTMRLTLPWEEYDGPAIGAFFQELEERVSSLPGVEGVGAGSQFPTVAFSFRQVAVEGQERSSEGQLPTALATLVSPGYFRALGIPVVRGRTFSDRDVEGTPLVAVVNEAAARLLFPGGDPMGRRIMVGDAPL